MKVKTINNYQFIIDKDDYKLISKYSWRLNKINGYIVTGNGLYLHRLINNTNEKMVTDHINGNKLDNRKSNLRSCSIKDNVRNCKIPKNNTSGFVGVSKHHTGKWRSYIMVDRKQINLGLFKSLENAIGARITGEIEYFGEFAPILRK